MHPPGMTGVEGSGVMGRHIAQLNNEVFDPVAK